MCFGADNRAPYSDDSSLFLKGTITLAAETTRSLSGLTLPAYVDSLRVTCTAF